MDNPRNTNNKLYGFVKFTNAPKVEGANNLIIFYSKGKIVGFYGKSEVLKEWVDVNERESYNLIADKNLSVVLTNKPVDVKDKGYLEDLNRVGQVGFSYLKETETALSILDEAIQLNPNLSGILNNIKNWIMEQNSIKEEFKKWMIRNDVGGGKISSYLRAIDILINHFNISVYNETNISGLTALYDDLISNQRDENGKYYYAKSPSYGNNGFYSASIGAFIDFLNNKGNDTTSKVTNKSKIFDRVEEIDLNQILYGPPGTGKTYKTKELAVQIAHPEFEMDSTWSEVKKREEINKKYSELFDSGQVLFTTFHQSFSYEDFVEGIKPETVDKNVTYDTIPGVFKEFCEKAGTKSASNFEQVLSQFKNDLGEQESITINTGSIEFDVFYRGGKTFKINPKESKNTNPQYPASIENILKVYKGEADEGMYNPTYVKGILTHLHDVYNLKSYDILESGNDKNFVLIIDEINRGNVSAIFGELITLLEPDKRLGEVEALRVKLPYSKSQFGVPPNIYIIGTMNTADRSVEALDTALRRRFSFKEVMPKPELLESLEFNDFNLNQVLQTINERIEVLLDRDHTIGHSYFMGLRSGDTNGLLAVFENKIIPLLQEYFYQDYEKIALVLGSGFVKLKVVQNVKFANFKGLEEPEIVAQFDLIDEIDDIELAVKQLLNLE